MGGFANSQQAYTENTGLNTTNSSWVDQRDPTQFDVNYVIGQFWQNQANLTLWYLNRKSNASGQLLATWEQIAAVTSFVSLSDTANTIVYPSTLADVPPENIQLVGGTGISVVATPASHLLTISLAGGGAAEKFAMQTGTSPVVPDGSNVVTFSGAVVAAGTNPVRTDGTGANTMTLEVQISQALAATDATKIGLSNFSNAQFAVDGNGFVTLVGGSGPVTLGLVPDAHTAPGTTPVVPNGSGNITLEGGATFATGTQANPIRTNSLAASTIDFQIQLAGGNAAVSTANNFGVSQFDTNAFTVTSGYVALKNGGTTGAVTNLIGDDTLSVVPAAGTGAITLNGVVVANATHAKAVFFVRNGANTEDLDVQLSAAIAATDITKVGLAAFNNAEFTVDANGFVSLVGGGASIQSIAVDANTPPGTNPVVPTLGQITVTGGQVAAGTTTNVIRTDSLAASTYTIQIQRSQAVASSTIGDNGVSHFDSARFTVDANGFVSLNGSGVAETITGQSGGALSPTAGNWNIFGASVAAGTNPVVTSGAVSTLTVNVQRSQAIASTNATNVGLAAFDSAVFTVDANAFVTIPNFNPFAYTAITNASSPYTVLSTDYYISCDSSGGAITIRLPNAPTTYRRFIIKDRVGSASTNNISITTVGGAVTIDGSTTYLLAGNWASVQLLFNGTSYEVY